MNSEQFQQWVGNFLNGVGAFLGWGFNNLTSLAIISVICLFGAALLVVVLRKLWHLLCGLWRRAMGALHDHMRRRRSIKYQD